MHSTNTLNTPHRAPFKAAAKRRAKGQRYAWIALWIFALSLGAAAVHAKVFLTRAEGLALAFPGCDVERTTVFLTAEQRDRAAELSGQQIDSSLVYPYQANCDGAPAGTAYLDTHRVRTLTETILVVVGVDGDLRQIEVLEFREPVDYVPPTIWYLQFQGKKLDRELQLRRAVPHVTGATLTARATTEAARRVLALHRAIQELPQNDPPQNQRQP